MKNLLKLEFRKLRKQKSFYICMVVMIGLLLLSVLTVNALSEDDLEISGQFGSSVIDVMVNAVNNSSFILIAGIFVVLLVCDDYEQQTIKNIYAKGYSRKQVYLSKLISVYIAATIMFIMVMISAFALGSYYFGIGAIDVFKFICVIAVQYLVCMANVGLSFLLSSLLRKNGSSIAATIIVPMIVNMLLGVLDSFIKLEKFSTSSLWISSFTGDLSTLTVGRERLEVCFAASLIYILIFAASGIYFHKKLEL